MYASCPRLLLICSLLALALIGGCGQKRLDLNGALTGGKRYLYEFSSESNVEIEGQGQFMQLTATGTWQLDVLRSSDQGSELALMVKEPVITSASAQHGAELAAIAPHLGGPFWVSLDSQGKLSQLRFKPGVHSLALGIVRSALAALQLARPASAKEPSWQAHEFDNTGEYVANYTLDGDGRLHKQKQKFLKLLTQSAARNFQIAPQADVLASRVDYTFDKQGRLQRLTLHERLKMTSKASPAIDSVSQVALTLKKVAASPAGEVPEASADLLVLKPDAAYLPEAHAGAVAARAGNLTFEQALSELQALGADDQDPEKMNQRSQLFASLTALLANKPENVDRAVAAIRGKGPLSDTIQRALAASADSYAQKRLVELMLASPKDDLDARMSTLISLSLAQDPSEQTTEQVIALMDDPKLGTQAVYGVGIHTRQMLGRGKLARADALLKLLTERMAQQPTRIITYLRALANASHPGAIPTLESALKSPASEVRVAALEAFRNLEPQRVLPVLVRALKDKAPEVRKAAAVAARKHELNAPLVEGLSKMARSDSDAACRYQAVETLAAQAASSPSAVETLRWVASNDAEEAHRKRASSALSAL